MRIARLVAGLAVLGVGLGAPRALDAWGAHGHTISGQAAATRLPDDMPKFFREAARQLAYLNPEPDRWRGAGMKELDEAFRYDHYLDLEIVPPAALGAEDRYDYLEELQKAGLADPARDAGLLPFRILELQQRLTVEFRLWRNARDRHERAWIEERIINDAGILGHYVTDAANPHHATIHFNGWAKGSPNPRGYTTDNTFHRRFESDFVGAQITLHDLLARVSPAPRRLENPRAEVLRFIRESNALVERLYHLDQQQRFGPENGSPSHKQFAVERLSAGVEMLRALWWTAWLESGTPVQGSRP